MGTPRLNREKIEAVRLMFVEEALRALPEELHEFFHVQNRCTPHVVHVVISVDFGENHRHPYCTIRSSANYLSVHQDGYSPLMDWDGKINKRKLRAFFRKFFKDTERSDSILRDYRLNRAFVENGYNNVSARQWDEDSSISLTIDGLDEESYARVLKDFASKTS